MPDQYHTNPSPDRLTNTQESYISVPTKSELNVHKLSSTQESESKSNQKEIALPLKQAPDTVTMTSKASKHPTSSEQRTHEKTWLKHQLNFCSLYKLKL